VIAACDECLRRTELIAWLAGRIEHEWRLRRGRPLLLALGDEPLLDWGADADVRARYADFSAAFARDRLVAVGLGAACRCSPHYPEDLRALPDPPAVLHTLGDAGLLDGGGVAVVGARAPTPYGREVAASLSRGLAAGGVPVVSGMARGIDSAAHAAALQRGRTVAVLATGADRAYPARSRELHRRIAANGCVVSELPPGHQPWRWAFPARNRLIAALSAGTVVVEGGERSGSLITADFAAELGRFVAAVPGPVTSATSAGPHALIKAGAEIVRDAADVLDLLHGATGGRPQLVVGAGDRPRGPAAPPPDLPPHLADVLRRVEAGAGSLPELAAHAGEALAVAGALGELEARGLVRRVFGGRYIRAAP
jgi:DNA processing protein